VALLLEHAFDEVELARAVSEAVEVALVAAPTPDLGGTASTTAFGDAVLGALASRQPVAL
jgi:isocitrate/isopropylmalate dehydrogenase